MGRIGVMQEVSERRQAPRRAPRATNARRTAPGREGRGAGHHRARRGARLDRPLLCRGHRRAARASRRRKLSSRSTAAELAYRAGRGAQADVFAARGVHAPRSEKASEARRTRRDRDHDARALGRSAAQMRRCPDRPTFAPLPFDRAQLETQLVASSADRDARAGRGRWPSAEAKVAHANRDPDWSVEVDYQQRGPGLRQHDVGRRQHSAAVGPRQPPGPRRRARSSRWSTRRGRCARTRCARTSPRSPRCSRNGRTAASASALYADSLLPLARERTAAALAAYRGGKGTLADVLAARRNELDVRRDALMLERETARLWAQLNYLDVPHDGNGDATPRRPAMRHRRSR